MKVCLRLQNRTCFSNDSTDVQQWQCWLQAASPSRRTACALSARSSRRPAAFCTAPASTNAPASESGCTSGSVQAAKSAGAAWEHGDAPIVQYHMHAAVALSGCVDVDTNTHVICSVCRSCAKLYQQPNAPKTCPMCRQDIQQVSRLRVLCCQ